MLRKSNLFNIQKEYIQLLSQIEEAEGEITPEIDQALQFTAQKLQDEGGEIGAVIKTLEYWEDTIEKELKRLDGLKVKAKRGKELLKNRLSQAMQQFGIERIESNTITISFRKSEGVEILDESAIPAAYFEPQPPKLSKTLIKDAIKAGKLVPGAEITQRQNIQIK